MVTTPIKWTADHRTQRQADITQGAELYWVNGVHDGRAVSVDVCWKPRHGQAVFHRPARLGDDPKPHVVRAPTMKLAALQVARVAHAWETETAA